MKYVTITGGLGNQMFIYAFCLSLRQKGKEAILFVPRKKDSKGYGHQGYELEKLFYIHRLEGCCSAFLNFLVQLYSQFIRIFPRKWKSHLFKLVGIHIVAVPENFIYYPEVFDFRQKNEMYMGTWQSQKYFEDATPAVRKAFVFKEDFLSLDSRNVAVQMNNEQSVSIHIRRGDYMSDQYANGFAGVCTPDYYKSAINTIKVAVNDPHFYVFTDDKEWVSENFKLENATYINHNTGKYSWQDMYLMSKCKHNIIANSSFSWWGAWLNLNKNKIVIAPKVWWRGIENDNVVPEGWIRI